MTDREVVHEIPEGSPGTHHRWTLPISGVPGIPVVVRVISNGEIRTVQTHWEGRTIQFDEPLIPGDRVSIIFHPIERF